MADFRADIVNFIVALATTLLGFFNGTENELTEEQISGIEKVVALIFGA